eukprot:gene28446-56313_t
MASGGPSDMLSAREGSLGHARGQDAANAQLLARITPHHTPWGAEFVGDYRVIRTLGKGSSGVLDRSPDVRRRAETEVRVLTEVRHPHICAVYDVIDTTEHKYIVMEHLSGGELYDLILKRGKLTPEEQHVYFSSAALVASTKRSTPRLHTSAHAGLCTSFDITSGAA